MIDDQHDAADELDPNDAEPEHALDAGAADTVDTAADVDDDTADADAVEADADDEAADDTVDDTADAADAADDTADDADDDTADEADEAGASEEDASAIAGTFASLGLRPELLAALDALGYEEPTPIQLESIPPLLTGRDLLGQAATGTGKTAAFALPLLQRLSRKGRGDAPTALVLVPTRELAMQVSEAMHKYGRELGARVVPIYGGQHIGRQLQALARGVDVVVATPGRAIDHITRETLALDEIRTVVLDEADEMFDMGFAEDIELILEATPSERQTVLFSATLPPRIASIAKRHLHDPVRIHIEAPRVAAGEQPRVQQRAYVVPRAYKAATLGRVLDIETPAAAIVFCRTRTEVDQLTETLNGRGYRAEALHGGMNQETRDRVMTRVRNGTTELLIATDVAARGLDIEQLTHVVNYDVPSAPESYVHRIGRVGRAGREGVAITLADPREHRLLQNIERITKQRISIEKVPTVAELAARQMELTRAQIREAIVGGGLDRYRAVVESLADEFDVVEVALAGVKLAHEAEASTDEDEIPDASHRVDRDRDRERGGRERTSGDRGERDQRGRGPRESRTPREPSGGMTRIYVGAGREAGIRPGDLVGAIANETSVSGREIGAIEIAGRFALVEVPDAKVEEVIRALRSTTIKGKKPTVRRERFTTP
jgi:ATP-dependent RNA helicase DeaD